MQRARGGKKREEEEGVRGGGDATAAAARAPEPGGAAAATAAERAPSGLAGGKRRVGAVGGAGRSRPPLSLPPSMGAGASRPPQPPEEGDPRRAVTSELGLSSPRGRARQDCCSRWPSTYQLAVRQVRDAFVLVRPRTNLGWRRRRAGI